MMRNGNAAHNWRKEERYEYKYYVRLHILIITWWSKLLFLVLLCAIDLFSIEFCWAMTQILSENTTVYIINIDKYRNICIWMFHELQFFLMRKITWKEANKVKARKRSIWNEEEGCQRDITYEIWRVTDICAAI